MVTATPHTVTHPNCDARDAAGVILANVKDAALPDVLKSLARAEKFGCWPIGRAQVTHTGYVRNAVHYDASTAIYRVTLGRLV
jgi:hypothetical protein